MNCDQAFDYLTDSARRDSRTLSRHLAGCPRCRQLKETLEPALDLFENLAVEPGIDSFESPDRATAEESVRIAEQSAERLSRRGGWISSGRRNAVRYAAAFLIGAALVFGLTAAQSGDGSPPSDSICVWQNNTAAADRGDRDAVVVIQSCVSCHGRPAEPADNTSAYNFSGLNGPSELAVQSRDWLRPPLNADRLLASCGTIPSGISVV